jgi:hypothetical protein
MRYHGVRFFVSKPKEGNDIIVTGVPSRLDLGYDITVGPGRSRPIFCRPITGNHSRGWSFRRLPLFLCNAILGMTS